MSARVESRFPKARIDALTDGVFAFAMTLLVLDIRLPDDLAAASAGELTAHLVSLWHQTLTYIISFFVLGSFWRGGIALRPSGESVESRVVGLTLAYLFFVTTVPFSSGLVGRFGSFTPAVVVYAANMAALGALAIALRYFDVVRERRSLLAAAGSHLPLLLATALLSVLIGHIAPHYAMYAYLLNGLAHLPFVPRIGYRDAE